jgi:DNA mismatch repair protein MSH6
VVLLISSNILSMLRACSTNLIKVCELFNLIPLFVYRSQTKNIDSDELTPVDGKDEEYDGIMTELNELEETLEKELKKLEKKVGYGCAIPRLLLFWLRHSLQNRFDLLA